jgi:hypothetical protein
MPRRHRRSLQSKTKKLARCQLNRKIMRTAIASLKRWMLDLQAAPSTRPLWLEWRITADGSAHDGSATCYSLCDVSWYSDAIIHIHSERSGGAIPRASGVPECLYEYHKLYDALNRGRVCPLMERMRGRMWMDTLPCFLTHESLTATIWMEQLVRSENMRDCRVALYGAIPVHELNAIVISYLVFQPINLSSKPAVAAAANLSLH